LEQTSLTQSPLPWQSRPTLHFVAHEPPQSTSVSSPSFAKLVHCATHAPLLQKVLEQSEPALHVFPSAHFVMHEPPQSMSVSSPFLILSMHVASGFPPPEPPPPSPISLIAQELPLDDAAANATTRIKASVARCFRGIGRSSFLKRSTMATEITR
jgi:hypothetical protein